MKKDREKALEHLSRGWDYKEQLDDLKSYMNFYIDGWEQRSVWMAIHNYDRYGYTTIRGYEMINMDGWNKAEIKYV